MIDTGKRIWYNRPQHDGKENVRMPRSDALKRAQDRYQGKLMHVKFWVNPETEGAIVDKLKSVDNRAKYIKDLIQQDIERKGGK